MAGWRSAAIERLPELRKEIASSYNLMSLWITLWSAFEQAYREPRNDDLIARIYSYADWCVKAPRRRDPGADPATAVTVAFYEHIPESKPARADMPKWFTFEEVASMRSTFSYRIGDEAYAELLAEMKKPSSKWKRGK